ncbi:Chaperone protein DnaK [hydrothermal vent metagenome]|uniref:Chaperone protein DnaK n=1 Tax=hydrothermal vent metagenome TaxID=652676 RepID=A0A3B0ZL97_9ZZZZ
MSTTETVIGIDLGTTNSEVAVVCDGQVTVLEIDNGSRLLPSVVGIGDDGTLLVGEAALNQYGLHPERTIKSIKRRMGSDFSAQLGEHSYSPQEVSAIILKRLKAVAETHLGQPVQKAVITVPAYFSDVQRQATREAGEIAGLEVARIINEPTAAALAYESNHSGHKQIMVYDLGGGTFDVSVVRLEEGVVEVLASHGDNHLGGDDFDQKIVEHIQTHLEARYGLPADELSNQAKARLQRAAEAAKITLSDNPFAMLEEEYLQKWNDEVIHLSLELNRTSYEAMIQGFIDKTLEAAHIALEGAKLSVSDLDEVLLVGGATRTPLVSDRLEQDLGLRPRSEVNPDLCVATGAAIQGAVTSGQQVSSLLLDITPYTFGTNALADFNGELYPYTFIPIIHKNSTLPVTKSDVFFTCRDNQESVEVMVFQGEDRDALNNTEIGCFHLKGLSKVPQGNEIITTFELDINGILQVKAREKSSGLEINITIENAMSQLEEQQLSNAQTRIKRLFEGDFETEAEPGLDSGSDVAQQREQTQVQALIEKAERLMESAGGEDREDLIDRVEQLNDALAQGGSALQQATEALSDLIFYLES